MYSIVRVMHCILKTNSLSVYVQTDETIKETTGTLTTSPAVNGYSPSAGKYSEGSNLHITYMPLWIMYVWCSVIMFKPSNIISNTAF